MTEVQVLKMLKSSRHATEVEEVLETIGAREFGPGESPLRELAQIGFLLRQGVTVSQITSLYQTDHFPALRSPEAQSALVQLVEREGHETIISQVKFLPDEDSCRYLASENHQFEVAFFLSFLQLSKGTSVFCSLKYNR